MGRFPTKFSIFVVLNLLLCSTLRCQAQAPQAPVYHEIRLQKLLYPDNATYSSNIAVTKEPTLQNFGKLFSNPSILQICVLGMWALYSIPNYAEDFDSTTVATPIRGYYAQSCQDMTPELRNVKSARYLGNAISNQGGLVIYSEPNFLGSRYYAPVNGKTATTGPPVGILATGAVGVDSIKLGSIAVTGAVRIRLCSDKLCQATVVCIDTVTARNGYYFNPNVATAPTLKWPSYVRAYAIVTDADACEADGSPPPQRSLPSDK